MGRRAIGKVETPWFGADPVWFLPLQRDARRRFGSRLRCEAGVDARTYLLDDFEVIGDDLDYLLTIRFYRDPPFDTFGLPACDYPEVRTSPVRESKHLFVDGRQCVWKPGDPPEDRWTSDDGLLILIELVRRQLFFALHWRRTGGKRTGKWLMEDAHG